MANKKHFGHFRKYHIYCAKTIFWKNYRRIFNKNWYVLILKTDDHDDGERRYDQIRPFLFATDSKMPIDDRIRKTLFLAQIMCIDIITITAPFFH